MKKILIGMMASLMLLVGGCSSNYERNTDMGEIVFADFTDMQEKMDNKETFMMVFTGENCSHCIKFKEEVLANYIIDHGFTFNEVIMERQSDMAPLYEFVEKNPNPSKFLTSDMDPKSIYTPAFYFIVDGEVKDIHIGEMDEQTFDGYVTKYQFDKVVTE